MMCLGCQIRPPIWEFPKIGVPYCGVLIIRILLFNVLYWGLLFSETPICEDTQKHNHYEPIRTQKGLNVTWLWRTKSE